MKLFFSLDGEPVKGDFFHAQFLDACRSEDAMQTEQGETLSYYYTIAIAPLTDTPYKMTRIEIQPLDDDVFSYLQTYGSTGNSYSSSGTPVTTGAYGYDDIVSSLPMPNSQDSFPQKHDEFQAYALGISFNNLGTAPLEQAGLSPEDFEQRIRGIRLVIHYGLWQKDEIVLRFDGAWDEKTPDGAYSFFGPLDVYEGLEK